MRSMWHLDCGEFVINFREDHREWDHVEVARQRRGTTHTQGRDIGGISVVLRH